MSRRAARVAAVEILYGADLRAVEPSDVLAERDDVDAYTRQVVTEVARRRLELDGVIGRHAIGWTTDRMSTVDRNVLRVGALELLSTEVPPAAVIDEAVEIAKRFSGEDAGRFVNGVLNAVLQELAGSSGSVGRSSSELGAGSAGDVGSRGGGDAGGGGVGGGEAGADVSGADGGGTGGGGVGAGGAGVGAAGGPAGA